MTEHQKKQRKVTDLIIHAAYAQQQVEDCQQQLADASACQVSAIHQGRTALFDLYVSSSHRWFVKFLKENGG